MQTLIQENPAASGKESVRLLPPTADFDRDEPFADQQTEFSRALSTFDVREHTSAPLRLEGEFVFAVAPERLFPRITDPQAIAGWFGMVKGGHLDHSCSCEPGEWGSGSKRICLTSMGTLEETIHSHETPYLSAYNVRSWSLPVDDHLAVMQVEPLPDGGSKLTWRHYFNDKNILLSRIIPKLLAAMTNSGMGNLANEMGGRGGGMKVIPLTQDKRDTRALAPSEATA